MIRLNCKIPFTKEILFEKKIHEITSISLEHEITIESDTLKGNFIVSGDFKTHEVSVNKEAFSYILPFEIALSEDIDKDTIEFMIEDFTYEVINNNTLKVNIDFNVIGSTKELPPKEEPTLFRDISEAFADKEISNPEIELKEEKEETIEELPKIPEIKGEDVRNEPQIIPENNEIEQNNNERTEIPKNEENIITSHLKDNEEYATYHIHMVNDGESVETICTMYNSNLNILSEYNELNDLTSGDKLIIPENYE